MKSNYLVFLFFSLILFSNCKDEVNIYEVDDKKIRDYLAEKGITAQLHNSGIYYVIDKPGTGKVPNLYSTVIVHYEGTVLNGKKFDSSYDRGEPSQFSLYGVIRGWQYGIPLFKEGGKGTLYIPSYLAYGASSPSADIPANSVLVFKIELFQVD